MSQRQWNQGEEKGSRTEMRELFRSASADSKREFGHTGEVNLKHSFKVEKGSNKNDKEQNRLKAIRGFSKEAFLEQQESESIIAGTSSINRSQNSNKEATSKGKERKMQRRESPIDFVCWKSPYEEEEICFPSSSQVPSNPNVRSKKKNTKQPIYEELTCPACEKLYVNPQLLPCNHNICESCIPKQKEISKKGLIKHLSVTCPVCQEKHYFTSTEKVKFPENFLLSEVLNRVEKRNKKLSRKSTVKQPQHYCQLCEKKNKQPAVKKCEICDLNFCKDCLKQHNRTYTDHNFVEPLGGEQQIKCFYHPDTLLTMFCTYDNIPICEECSKEKHKDHSTSSISDAFKDQSIHLFHVISKYGKAKDESENDMLRLSIFKSMLQENRIKFQKQVSENFLTLHNQLSVKEKQVKAIYDTELNFKIANINNFMDSTAQHMLNTEGLIQYAKEAAKEMDEFVLLQTVNHLIKQLKEKVNGIHMSEKDLMTNPADINSFDFGRISEQINQIFQPITEKYEMVKAEKVMTLFKKKIISPTEVQPEIKESETPESEKVDFKNMEIEIKASGTNQPDNTSTPLLISQENIPETDVRNKESRESLESEHGAEDDKQKNIQEQNTNIDTPVPPTIYHHIINGSTTKIFWMVPEYDVVDSFDVHLQEVGYNDEAVTPQQIGVVFSGIDASSFETTLKDNTEVVFRVRAVNDYGESAWSYPYRVNILAVLG
ncbi:tripartite motif-containing protein 42-like [Narcine bancroftii]|uniref:tripartite motif-containing protein 42-like n=1 Tax=Narcine bancroftii TaxID=1343680 RepID=UPI0038310473